MVSKYTIKRDKIAAPVSIFALSRINHLIARDSFRDSDASSFSRCRDSLFSLLPFLIAFQFSHLDTWSIEIINSRNSSMIIFFFSSSFFLFLFPPTDSTRRERELEAQFHSQ